ncbi:MAG: hypothetical protein ACRYFY_14990 [Janthinobacterium lividum]
MPPRELHTRYGRETIGFLWIIGEPILFCGGVTILWTAMRPTHEHGLPMTAIDIILSRVVEKSVGVLSDLALPFFGAFSMVDRLPPCSAGSCSGHRA